MKRILTAALIALSSSAHAFAFSSDDIEAIGRTARAEAGRSLAGRISVVETILNRWKSGMFGSSVQEVIMQRNAFEPVTRAGSWRNLPPLTEAQKDDINDILFMKSSGHLGELTGGATYFQNEEIVKLRAAKGQVRPELIGFNGMPKVAQIKGHTFYAPKVMPIREEKRVEPSPSGKRPVVSMMVFGGD